MLESDAVVRLLRTFVEPRVQDLSRELPVITSLDEGRLGSADYLVWNVGSDVAFSCHGHVRQRPLAVWEYHAFSAIPIDRIPPLQDMVCVSEWTVGQLILG
jgi:hypothetical protein